MLHFGLQWGAGLMTAMDGIEGVADHGEDMGRRLEITVRLGASKTPDIISKISVGWAKSIRVVSGMI